MSGFRTLSSILPRLPSVEVAMRKNDKHVLVLVFLYFNFCYHIKSQHFRRLSTLNTSAILRKTMKNFLVGFSSYQEQHITTYSIKLAPDIMDNNQSLMSNCIFVPFSSNQMQIQLDWDPAFDKANLCVQQYIVRLQSHSS